MVKFQAILIDRHEKVAKDGTTTRLTLEVTESEAHKVKSIPMGKTNLYIEITEGEVNDSTVD